MFVNKSSSSSSGVLSGLPGRGGPPSAVQQVQSPAKFDIPAFEGDSAASWLMWSQRVVCQARACGFEAEVIAAEGQRLSVGADVFYGSNVDPVRLRNAHVAWMVFIKNWHLKSCNVTKHRMMSGEISNRNIERREQKRYFTYRSRLTENDGTRRGSFRVHDEK